MEFVADALFTANVGLWVSTTHTEPKPGERVSAGAAQPHSGGRAAMADTAPLPPAAAPAGPGINPLSRKLNKILETRLDNDKVGRAAGPGPAGQRRPRCRAPCRCGAPGGRSERCVQREAWHQLCRCSPVEAQSFVVRALPKLYLI